MIAKQKELVLIPYPFTDQSGTKVRPAIIVSNDEYNDCSDDCVLVPVTSVLKDDKYSLSLTQTDLNSGTLVTESRIKVDKIFCIDKKLIIKKIGNIKGNTFKKIVDKFNTIL